MANYIHKGAFLRITQLALNGASIRSLERSEGVDQNTIIRWLLKLGEGAAILNDRTKNLKCDCVEFDEHWSWVGVKEENKKPYHPTDFGERWTFLAVDKKSKMIIASEMGRRNKSIAHGFLSKLKSRLCLQQIPQLVSDGWEAYAGLVARIFGRAVPYVQIVKHPFGKEPIPIQIRTVQGANNPTVRSTSAVERVNGYFRDWLRRFSRKTKAFSKSVKHHDATIELFIAFYNYAWAGNKSRSTPAFAAGLSLNKWTLEELITQLLHLAGAPHPGFNQFPQILRVEHPSPSKTSPSDPIPLRGELHPWDEPVDRRGPKYNQRTNVEGRSGMPPLARPPRQKPPPRTDTS